MRGKCYRFNIVQTHSDKIYEELIRANFFVCLRMEKKNVHFTTNLILTHVDIGGVFFDTFVQSVWFCENWTDRMVWFGSTDLIDLTQIEKLSEFGHKSTTTPRKKVAQAHVEKHYKSFCVCWKYKYPLNWWDGKQ